MSDKLIPRMRTAAKIVAELRAMDPGCEVTEYYIRQLIREGAVPVVWAPATTFMTPEFSTVL